MWVPLLDPTTISSWQGIALGFLKPQYQRASFIPVNFSCQHSFLVVPALGDDAKYRHITSPVWNHNKRVVINALSGWGMTTFVDIWITSVIAVL